MKISIILLSYENERLLRSALGSIDHQVGDCDVEVIVVDNASRDGSPSIARATDGLALEANLGFAHGMNIGYLRATGDVICFMNCDVILHPEFIQSVVLAAETLGSMSPWVLAPLVTRWDGTTDPEQYWSERSLELDGGPLWITRTMRVGLLDENLGEARVVDKANGACPVVSRTALRNIELAFGHGPFDPRFGTYGEDIDFALKCRRLCIPVQYWPKARAGHVRSASSSQELINKRPDLRRNLMAARYINAQRHLPPQERWVTVALIGMQDLVFGAYSLAYGRFGIMVDVFAAAWRGLRAGKPLPGGSRKHSSVARPTLRRRLTPLSRTSGPTAEFNTSGEVISR